MNFGLVGQPTPPEKHPWEKKENTQTYDLLKEYGEHPQPRQHILGIVGGNEVPFASRAQQVHIESDLRGITRLHSFCPSRKYAYADYEKTTLNRNTVKESVAIDTKVPQLRQAQMWAYPATLAPEELTIQTCARPEKY